MKIRDAIETDLPVIVEIYNQSIPSRMATGDITPITVESRLNWYREHSAKSRPIWVIESENIIIGWLSFQDFYYRRPAYHTTAELSIYIMPEYHHKGVGKKLLETAIIRSPEFKIKTLLGFIFAHNYPSLGLFEKFGFSRWGYLPQIADLDGSERDLVIVGLRINPIEA